MYMGPPCAWLCSGQTAHLKQQWKWGTDTRVVLCPPCTLWCGEPIFAQYQCAHMQHKETTKQYRTSQIFTPPYPNQANSGSSPEFQSLMHEKFTNAPSRVGGAGDKSPEPRVRHVWLQSEHHPRVVSWTGQCLSISLSFPVCTE